MTLIATNGTAPGIDEGTLRLEALAGSVERYSKIEFVIHLDRHYRNPFDPSEVDLILEITTPKGERLVLPAFLYQHYERRMLRRGGRREEWLYPVGKPEWRARFSPSEVGTLTSITSH